MNFWIILQGFTLGAGMIIPIGAQNAFVLNQGIKRQHHLSTALTCSLSDLTFICLGIFGGGALLSSHPLLLQSITIVGVIFLTFYGVSSFKSAFMKANTPVATEILVKNIRRRSVIIGALAVSILNPHVYIDTVVVLGSVGGQFQGTERIAFAIGTIIASFTWFFVLATAAAKLSNQLSRPKVQVAIDLLVGFIMLFIAYKLVMTL